MMLKMLVNATEMAKMLSLSPKTVSAWARDGKIPAIKAGYKTFRFDPAKVMAALERLSKKEFEK